MFRELEIGAVGAGSWPERLSSSGYPVEWKIGIDPDSDASAIEIFDTAYDYLEDVPDGELEALDVLLLTNRIEYQGEQLERLEGLEEPPTVFYNKSLAEKPEKFPREPELEAYPLMHYHQKEAALESADLMEKLGLRADAASYTAREPGFSEPRGQILADPEGGIQMDLGSHTYEFISHTLDAEPRQGTLEAQGRSNVRSEEIQDLEDAETWLEEDTYVEGSVEVEGSNKVEPGTALSFEFGKNTGEESKWFGLAGEIPGHLQKHWEDAERWKLEADYETEQEPASIRFEIGYGPSNSLELGEERTLQQFVLPKSPEDSSKYRVMEQVASAANGGEPELCHGDARSMTRFVHNMRKSC